jgi:hypothetical protein
LRLIIDDRIVSHIEKSLSTSCIISQIGVLRVIKISFSFCHLFIIDFIFQLLDLQS